jgi:hypothetical protein
MYSISFAGTPQPRKWSRQLRAVARRPAGSFERLAMGIGVGVGNGVQGLVEAKRPQNGDVSPERNAGLAELQRVERIAIDPGLLCDFRDGQSAEGPGQTYPIAQLLGALRSLKRDSAFLCPQY